MTNEDSSAGLLQPQKKEDVKNTGWYLVFAVGDEQAFLYEFDKEGIWRSVTGHAVTLEQPDYFDDSDRFVGPLELDKYQIV